MKNLKYILCVGLLSLGLNSCDLETEHPYAVSQNLAFTTLENADYIVNGAWKQLWETINTQAGPGFLTAYMCSDYMGSDVVECGKYGFSAAYQYTAMASGTSTQTVVVWRNLYYSIDNLNGVIGSIDGIPGDATTRNRIKAQALAFRGYLYLDLGTFYGSGYHNQNELIAPIYTEPSTSSTEGKPRSTLAQIYKQAEDDLLAAHGLIGSYDRKTAKHKINKNVIAGLLARLYLYKGEWINAQKYAEEAHNGYPWMAQDLYSTGFNLITNAEWIWGHQQTPVQNTAGGYYFGYKDVTSETNDGGYASMMCDPYFMDELFDPATTDIRYDLFEWCDEDRAKGFLMYKKFRKRSDGSGDFAIMRKAEMALIEAEAYAEMGQLGDAITALNSLRTARNAETPNLSTLSQTDLVEEILKERRKELWGEGFSLIDVKRKQKTVNRRLYPEVNVGSGFPAKGHTMIKLPNGDSFSVGSSYYSYVIPTSEYTNNPNL